MLRFTVFLLSLSLLAEASLAAGPLRRHRRGSNQSVYRTTVPTRTVATPASTSAPAKVAVASSKVATPESTSKSTRQVDDALEEVNAERAKRGLRPFLPDPALNKAAQACAKLRASRHIAGHLSNDFAYLPAGATAKAAGCGALEPSWGWGTCCTYENYTYAGAAWVMGSDGNRYMHLFVR